MRRGKRKGKKARGFHVIICDILVVVRANRKILKTGIMYKANLSWPSLTKFLGIVLDQGLVRLTSHFDYVITEKGLVYIKKFNELEELLGKKKV